MKINFNSLNLGRSGGNRCIFELANGLVDKGHDVTITHSRFAEDYLWFDDIKAKVVNLNFPSTIARAFRKYYLRKRFIDYDEETFLQKNIPDCDVNVAGWCMTAYPTYYSQKGKMFYLVQHYEPWFYPDNKSFVAKATLSYQLPMTKLCVSQWLTEKVNGVFIGNGINLQKFKPNNVMKQYDVMVMPKTIKWKGNYTPVIEALRYSGLKVLVVDSMSEFELVQAYNLSKTFLYLSEHEGFGYPPLEAMGCGTPVISTLCTEYLKDNKNAIVLQKNYSTDAVVSKVKWLIQNKDYADFLSEAGLKTAQEFNFTKVVDRFEAAIQHNFTI